MSAYCTCGAELPPDARFCHKCGKPQFEMLQPEPEVVPELPLAAAEPAQPVSSGVSFRNPIAVRAALGPAVCAAALMLLPLPVPVNLLWQALMLVAGGFLAVFVYQRRTRTFVGLRSGAQLGWITGIFCFLIWLVVFTLMFAALAGNRDLQRSFEEILTASGNGEAASQIAGLLQSPSDLAVALFGALFTWLVMLTGLATLGGALGAKVLEKE